MKWLTIISWALVAVQLGLLYTSSPAFTPFIATMLAITVVCAIFNTILWSALR